MSLHLAADQGEIAAKLLLTDDPMRVKLIAADYLENAKCHNEIRSMFGYTGTYKEKRISVQSFGMGAPALSVYTRELLNEYGVESIIYVGTCAAAAGDLKNRDVVLAMGACTDSAIAKSRFGDIQYTAAADFGLLSKAMQKAAAMGINAQVINLFSTDSLDDGVTVEKAERMAAHGIKAFDMETCELYTLAAGHGARALSILTVSDEIRTGRRTSPAERQSTFHDMIKLAFETI